MSRDHVEVARLTEELGSLRAHLVGTSVSTSQEQALRRVLYGLSAIVRVHFAKEEEIYLPVLDARLTAGEAHQVFAAMERAARSGPGARWGDGPHHSDRFSSGWVASR